MKVHYIFNPSSTKSSWSLGFTSFTFFFEIFFFLFCMPWASSSIGRRKHVLQVSLMIQMGAVESFDAKTCYDHNSTMLIFTLCVLDANFAKFYKLAGTSMETNLLNQTRQYYRFMWFQLDDIILFEPFWRRQTHSCHISDLHLGMMKFINLLCRSRSDRPNKNCPNENWK